jgi:hypothetical protein
MKAMSDKAIGACWACLVIGFVILFGVQIDLALIFLAGMLLSGASLIMARDSLATQEGLWHGKQGTQPQCP